MSSISLTKKSTPELSIVAGLCGGATVEDLDLDLENGVRKDSLTELVADTLLSRR